MNDDEGDVVQRFGSMIVFVRDENSFNDVRPDGDTMIRCVEILKTMPYALVTSHRVRSSSTKFVS